MALHHNPESAAGLDHLILETLASMPAAVLVVDTSGEIIYSNRAAARFVEASTGEVPGGRRASWNLVDEDGSPCPQDQHPSMRCLREGRAVRNSSVGVLTPTGDLRWLRMDAIPIHAGGSVVAAAVVFVDDTERRAVDQELSRAEARLTLARQAAAVGLWEWEIGTQDLRHDDGITSIAGCELSSIDDWLSRVHPEDRDRMAGEVAAVIAGEPSFEVRYRFIAADGTEKHVIQRAVIVEWDGERPTRMAGSTFDSTALYEANERMQHLLDCMTDAYFLIAEDWRLTYVNRSAEQVLGRRASDMVGRSIWDVFPDAVDTEFHRSYERAMAGEPVEFEEHYPALDAWYEVRAHPVRNGIAVYFRDVTSRRRAAEEREALLRSTETARNELAHAAMHDLLTGLPNRMATISWLEDHLHRGAAPGDLALLFLDLDRFKLVNDTHGHAEGDLLLMETARRLRERAPRDAFVARLGGDEFVVGLEGRTKAQVHELAQELVAAFQEPFDVRSRRLVVTASIGVALDGRDATPITLLRDADAAMYQAKEQGRNCVRAFDEQIRQLVVGRLDTEADLREAIERGELHAHYQPIYAAVDGRAVAAEALCRWRHPERGNVSPDKFIPVAEDSGLILPLGDVMIDSAVRDRPALDRVLGIGRGRVWVNVAGRQLEEPGFADRLLARVEIEGLRGRFGIEVTEGVLTSDPRAGDDVLPHIAEGGVAIAIDDFGTGYSSFARLMRYPVTLIKVDRSFVAELGSSSGRSLVRSIVELGHALGADVCAEGVETVEQRAVLRDLGVDEMSGYVLCPPDDLEGLDRRGAERWADAGSPKGRTTLLGSRPSG